MSESRGLGKGFDTLVPVGVDVFEVVSGPQEKIHKLAIDIVKPRPDQPRKTFDQLALDQLAQSIKEHGILMPLVVVQSELDDLYHIIAGERRWRAAQLAGLSEVPVVIRTASDLEQLELSILENVQREDLSPLETAASIQRLANEFGKSYEEIAQTLGKAYTTVVNLVRLLNLPEEIQVSINNKLISEGHARALQGLAKYPKDQELLFRQIVDKGWSVRQAESFAAAVKKSAKLPKSEKTNNKNETNVISNKIAENVSKYFGLPAKIHHTQKGGKLVVSFKTEEDLKRISELIDKR